jgi:hypothetical protein
MHGQQGLLIAAAIHQGKKYDLPLVGQRAQAERFISIQFKIKFP